MNTKSVVFFAMSLCSAYCFGQSNVVYYGANSNALNVVFVDTNLSKKAQTAIIADLRICLMGWGREGELYLRDKDDSVGYLSFGRRCPHYPEDIDFPKNIVSNGTSGVALQIPKELSDAYTNAFKFAAANAKAFAAANAFVKFVSSTNFLNIPPKTLPDYVLERDLTAAEIIANAQETIPALHEWNPYPPSVLGLKYLFVGPGAPAASNLFLRVPCAGEDKTEWSSFPAIWHEGKWKFCNWGWLDGE
jgi:hypothetical protein